MRILLLSALLSLALPLAPLSAADAPPTSPATSTQPAVEKLTTKIGAAIQLLEERQYAAFVRFLADPRFVAAADKKGEFDKIAEDFARESAAPMLAALKQAQKQEPQTLDDGRIIVYKVNVKNQEELRFFLFQGKWYLR